VRSAPDHSRCIVDRIDAHDVDQKRQRRGMPRQSSHGRRNRRACFPAILSTPVAQVRRIPAMAGHLSRPILAIPAQPNPIKLNPIEAVTSATRLPANAADIPTRLPDHPAIGHLFSYRSYCTQCMKIRTQCMLNIASQIICRIA
jgi:hypothetical protein